MAVRMRKNEKLKRLAFEMNMVIHKFITYMVIDIGIC